MTTATDRETRKRACVETVLGVLRRWGWETGIARLEEQVRTTKDPEDRAVLNLFIGWIACERGEFAEGRRRLAAARELPRLLGWSLAGEAYMALRSREAARALPLLEEAEKVAEPEDVELRATIDHFRGTVLYHDGRLEDARRHLLAALERYRPGDFGRGRVLDTLGMYYSARNTYYLARQFYERALEAKRAFGDDAGLAVTHGNLGRLNLSWGYLEEAERHFHADLEIVGHIHDVAGEATMYNQLGQVALERYRRERVPKFLDDAAKWLDEGVRLAAERGFKWREGYSRKDRALAHAWAGDLAAADRELDLAEALLEFPEGKAHVARARAIVRRLQGRHEASESELRSALAIFDTGEEPGEAARTLLEHARTLLALNRPRPRVVAKLLEALRKAELSQRDGIIREVEAELRAVDESQFWMHAYRRVRGAHAGEDSSSLLKARRETVTVMFFDIRGYSDLARVTDPAEIALMLNQMHTDLSAVLARHDTRVNQYLGDGFMAIVSGSRHAERAVLAALELGEALTQFNEPRRILGLRELEARIGIASGEVILANVGTFQKMDFTAVGTTANLAARLQSEASPGRPCVNQETWQLVRERFAFVSPQGRPIDLKGVGQRTVWDVAGELGGG